MDASTTEKTRIEIQNQIDSTRTQLEKNRLGQFATPPSLASDMFNYARQLIDPHEKIRFLDPAFGMGSFYSALLRAFPISQIADATGYEIDSTFGLEATNL